MEKELKRIFNDFRVDSLEIPFKHLRYSGNKKTYIVWSMQPETPAFSSDDEVTYSEVNVDIDIYSDSNYLNIMSLIKNKMKENEWVWDGDSPEMFEEDTGLYHRTCSFKKERKI